MFDVNLARTEKSIAVRNLQGYFATRVRNLEIFEYVTSLFKHQVITFTVSLRTARIKLVMIESFSYLGFLADSCLCDDKLDKLLSYSRPL